MRRAKVLGATLVVISAIAGAVPAEAQTVGADLGLFSSYVWRGLSLTNKPVAEPDLYVTFPAGQGLGDRRRLGQHRSRQVRRPGQRHQRERGLSAFNFAEFDP